MTPSFAARLLTRISVATAAAALAVAPLPSASTAPVGGAGDDACQPPARCAALGRETAVPLGTDGPLATTLRLQTPGPTDPDPMGATQPPVTVTSQPPRNLSGQNPADPTDPPAPDPTRTRAPDPTKKPAPDPTPEPDPTLAFAEECTNRLGSAWHALYGPGDPGYAEDADFMGDLRQVSVANGRCRITATRMSTPSGASYASAAMATKGNFAQRYGTFEVRVRYPAGQGIWPAFLLLRQQAVVTTPPEIDVFEAYPAPPGPGGGSGRSVAVSTLHSANGIHYFVYDHGSDMTTAFHTHRMTWSPGRLVFWIDGAETGRITQDVPDVAMFPVLALGVGAPGYRADASTPDTAVMEIDYVRVWTP